MTTEAPSCPRCGSPMVVRTAGRGQHEGQKFWGCTTYPACRGVIDVGPPADELVAAGGEVVMSPAGASAQAEFERQRQRNRERIRRQWPFAIGITLVLMLMFYLLVQAYTDARWGAVAAGAIALVMLYGFVQSPKVDAWGTGAEGERATARDLAGLGDAGFVILHDRRVPGYGGNIDHVAIGPTGVWAIETKSLRGKVEIDGDDLKVGGYRRDKIVDQVYREAVAVQVALGASVTKLGLTVTPVICLHRGELPFFNKTVRGVRLASGRQLARLLRTGEARLTAEQVQTLAREADRLLTPAVRR